MPPAAAAAAPAPFSDPQLANLTLILNLGGEMLYVLESRLKSYTADDGKVKEVLEGYVVHLLQITESIRSKPFTRDDLFKAFRTVVQSSAMRLTDSGLEKLFELLVMSFKYQLFACSFPLEVYLISVNHLKAWEDYCSSAKAKPRLTALRTKIEKLSTIGGKSLCTLRQDLNDLFGRANSKVSHFINAGIQSATDGSFVHRQDYQGFSPVPGDLQEYFSLFPEKKGRALEGLSLLGLNMFAETPRQESEKPAAAPNSDPATVDSTSSSAIDLIEDLDRFKDLLLTSRLDDLPPPPSDSALPLPPPPPAKGKHRRSSEDSMADLPAFDDAVVATGGGDAEVKGRERKGLGKLGAEGLGGSEATVVHQSLLDLMEKNGISF
ncbi:Protein oscp1 [Phlyctochytrium bullatum]|nr:Protein oscp1 [Phlyctochytrium bullatum]